MNDYIKFIFDSFIRTCADEYIFKDDVKYQELGEVFTNAYEKLENKLDEETLKEVDLLLDAISNLDERYGEILFESAFKLGSNLVLAVVSE